MVFKHVEKFQFFQFAQVESPIMKNCLKVTQEGAGPLTRHVNEEVRIHHSLD